MILNKDIFQEELDEIISIIKREHSKSPFEKIAIALEPKIKDIWTDQDSKFHYSLLMKEKTKCNLIKIKKFKNYTLVGYPPICNRSDSFRNYCITLVENKFLNNLLKTKPAFGGVRLKWVKRETIS